MKKITLTFLFILSTTFIFGKQVSESTALEAAQKFITSVSPVQLKSAKIVTLKKIEIGSINNKSAKLEPAYYAYNINDQGFIIISGEDMTVPILGYSFDNNISSHDLPDAFVELLDQYEREITTIRQQATYNTYTNPQWNKLLNGTELKSSKAYSDIAPLMSTTWSQSPYYNLQCPVNDENQRAITGCVATAMAQVMKHHNFPDRGQGFHDYIANSFGLQSIIYGNHSYNWNEMTNSLTAGSTNEAKNAVAKLMYHCGVGVSMNYGVSASGSTMGRLANALRSYFSYNENLAVRYMHSYTMEAWIDSIYNELTNMRPVLYAGFGSSSGHAFVLDGYSYQDGDKFHINWGWGGYNDGYFSLTALNPGAYPAGFNYFQHGIFGVEPDSNYNERNIILCDSIRFSGDTLYTESPFTIDFNLKNNDAELFTGNVVAVFFDQDSASVQSSNYAWNLSIDANDSVNGGIQLSGYFYSGPGKYIVGLFYQTANNNWLPVKNGVGTNYQLITVVASDSVSALELGDSLALDPESPVYNDSLSIHAHLHNRSGSVFEGRIKLKAYNQWGNIAETLDSTEVIQVLKDSTILITFSIDTLKLFPGKYYLSVFECPEASVHEFRIAEKVYSNSVPLVVLPIPPKGDKYENNDSIAAATPLEIVFSSNFFYKTFDSVSIHVDEDVDFYKLAMPIGSYSYSANIYTETLGRGDKEQIGSNYDEDEILTIQCYDGSSWTEPTNGSTSQSVLLAAGDTLWIKVFPFFTGLTTDYKLTVYINRTVLTKFTQQESLSVIYPTVVNDKLFINHSAEYSWMEIIALNGQILYTSKYVESAFYTDGLEKGQYLMRLIKPDGSDIKQIFIKQ